MGIPVKLKVDDFSYMGEEFTKGEVFNAPHEIMADFLCDQEKTATRVKESDCEPEQVGTNKRVLKSKGDNINTANNASYNTKVMNPGGSSNGKPVATKTGTKTKISAKTKVKAASNASSENT